MHVTLLVSHTAGDASQVIPAVPHRASSILNPPSSGAVTPTPGLSNGLEQEELAVQLLGITYPATSLGWGGI